MKMTPQDPKQVDPLPGDAEILDWLQSLFKGKGSIKSVTFSDSRDLGCRSDFLSGWTGWGSRNFKGKGNSVREVLAAMMRAAGWRRRKRKPIQVDGRQFDTPLDAALHLLWLLQRLSSYESGREGEPCDGPRFREGIREARKLIEILKYEP